MDEYNQYIHGWYLYTSLERQGTLGNMQIRLYTKQCVNLTLKNVDPYRHRTSVWTFLPKTGSSLGLAPARCALAVLGCETERFHLLESHTYVPGPAMKESG